MEDERWIEKEKTSNHFRNALSCLELQITIDPRKSVELQNDHLDLPCFHEELPNWNSVASAECVTVMASVRALSLEELSERDSEPQGSQQTCKDHTLNCSAWKERSRAPADFIICLDASGSMRADDKMNMLCAMLGFMLQHLLEGDRLGIVTFNETATIALPMQFVGASTLGQVLEVLRTTPAEGRTDLSHGMEVAIDQISKLGAEPGRISAVMLITDGLPNVGVTDARLLADAVHDQLDNCHPKTVNICAFGLGRHHSSKILSGLAQSATGAGSYHFINDFDNIPEAWESAVTCLLQVTAQNVRLRLKHGDQWSIYTVHSSYPQKVGGKAKNAVVLNLGDLCAGEEKNILFSLKLNHLPRVVDEKRKAAIPCSVKYYDSFYDYPNRLDHWAPLLLESPGSVQPNPAFMDIHRCRLEVVVALERARCLIENHQLEAALTLLHGTQQTLACFQQIQGECPLMMSNLVKDINMCYCMIETHAADREEITESCAPDSLNEMVHTFSALVSSHSRQRLGSYTPRPHYPLLKSKHLALPLSDNPESLVKKRSSLHGPLSESANDKNSRNPIFSVCNRTRSHSTYSFGLGRRCSIVKDPTTAVVQQDSNIVESSQAELGHLFEFNRIIGQGSHGVVLSACSVQTGQHVAVKRLPKTALECHFSALQVLREIKLMRHLGRHPNIMEILGVYSSPASAESQFSSLYIVMKLMDTDLQKVLNSSQELTVRHCWHFTYQLLLGILHMHSAGVLHRDLKPSNILVNQRCELKIADFGLARGVGQTIDEKGAEVEGTAYVVTRWYRAPEILLACQSYGGGVDIWSAGCIIAEILTRKPLFPGNNHIHQLQLIIKILGTPCQEDIGFVDDANSLHFINAQISKVGSTPHSKPHFYEHGVFQKAVDSGFGALVEIISYMLKFDPCKRLTSLQIIKKECFDSVRCKKDIEFAQKVSVFDFTFEKCVENDQDYFEVKKKCTLFL